MSSEFYGHLAPLAEPRSFAAWLRLLFRHDWVVYSKRPFGGPEHALRYLGAYTHRFGISNSRLLALSEGNVSFRWRDSAHGNKKRLMSLPVDEFLRRFLLHLLPRGFVRIRNFSFLANRQRATLLPLCFSLLQSASDPPTQAPQVTRHRPFRSARSAAERCTSSNGSHRPNCLLALHRTQTDVPHEPLTSASNGPHALAGIPVLGLARLLPPLASPARTLKQHSEVRLLQRTHGSAALSLCEPQATQPTRSYSTAFNTHRSSAPDKAASVKSLYLQRPANSAHRAARLHGRSR